MRKQGISQEWLKVIACVTMLVDHIGAVLVPQWLWLRAVGRISFPIYCFLLVEGVDHTRSPKRYGFRLLLGALLAEIPFDLALFGRITLAYQSVMLTLLLGFLMLVCMRRTGNRGIKILLIVPFALAAEGLRTDYGAMGVVIIALFALTKEQPQRGILQTIGLAVCAWLIGGIVVLIGNIPVPLEILAICAMIPISLYSGEKSTKNPWIQWGFYLFYPVHLLILWLITFMI